jgi:hypothetical protein
VNHSLSVFPLLIRAHRLGRRNRWSFWLQISSRLKTKARQKGVSLDSFAGPVHVEWQGGADAAWAIAGSSIF